MAPLSDDFTLTVRQGPERAKVAGPKEKERKPVDPPPIVQLEIRDPQDTAQNYLQSPYLFVSVNLCDADPNNPTDGGFFVFGDLSVKVEGNFCLRFSLFEMVKTEVIYIKSMFSTPFVVYNSKAFPGMSESTFLSRSFADQGVRLRIRKEPRSVLKRPPGPNLRPDDGQSMLDDPSPSPHRGAVLQSRRAPMGLYDHRYSALEESSPKRQRTSVDMDARSLYQPSQYHQRPYIDQRASAPAPFGNYPTSSLSTYSQGPQPALSSMSDYSYGHQRTNSSNTSSPFISPHTEVSGHSWTAANVPSSNMPSGNVFYQSPAKDTSYTYQQNQYPDMQYSRPNQLPESYLRQRTQTLPSQSLQSQNMSLQSLSSQNFASQSMASRLPANANFAFPRYQEPENPMGNYGQAARSLPSSTTFPELPAFNILPPIDPSSLASNSGRRGTQQLLPSTILPSIEPHTSAGTPSPTIAEQGQESYEGQESYDPSS
ncbi:MAG: hypothetical protein Q9208_005675 [Pyrenodesmia sp. 3 TL-2023]